MNNTNNTTIEQALSMYTETVSPSKENLTMILSHIPEKKNHVDRRAIRSPYIWIAITEVVTLFSILFVISSSLPQTNNFSDTAIQDPFYVIDMQVDQFEVGIQKQDYENSLIDYTL